MSCLCIDDLRPASFRGVHFWVANDTVEGGRRDIVHEYPMRDKPYIEDMGQKATRYKVSGYLVGDDWIAQKEALKAACFARGPALLQLPAEGPAMVACLSIAISRSKDECGFFGVQMEFVDATNFSAPAAVGAIESQIGGVFQAAIPIFTTFYDNNYVGANTLNFVSDNQTNRVTTFSSDVISAIESGQTRDDVLATDVVQSAISIYQNAAAYTQPGTDSGITLAQQPIPAQIIAKIATDTGVTAVNDTGGITIKSGAAAIVPMIAYAINGVGNALTGDVLIPALTTFAQWSVDEISVADLQKLVDGFSTVPTGNAVSVSDIADATNSMVFCGTVRSFALMKLAQAITAKTFRTRLEAVQARANVVELFNAQIEQFDEDEIVNILLQARDLAVRSISAKMANIVPLLTITATASKPSLYWAARLYEDVYRAEELSDRNSVASPAFMPPVFEALAR